MTFPLPALSHNHLINTLHIICMILTNVVMFCESELPACTASKCVQKLYCYEFAEFGNTDVTRHIQHLFLMEVMIVVVADRGEGLLVCFSWLLFLLNPPAPENLLK